MRVNRLASLALSLALAGTGCSGRIDQMSPDDGDGDSDDGSGGSAGDDGAGGSGAVGAGPAACKPTGDALVPARLWRLSAEQLANTLADRFGYKVAATALPADAANGQGLAGFDNNAAFANVGEQQALAYREVAAKAATALLPALEKEHACIFGAAAPDDGCSKRFVAELGAKAFRRPLDGEEERRLGTFFTTAAGKWGGKTAARLYVATLLQHPWFLYRSELGAASATGERVTLTPYERASQLSYSLADSAPDAELLEAAKAGKLASAADVRAHARRLVESPAGRKKVVDFFAQLLHVKGLGTLNKSPMLFPEFGEALRTAMQTETATFIEKVLFDEKGSYADLFSAKHSYVDERMAKLYGATAAGAGFVRTALPGERAGLLSHASVLAAASHPDATSPAHRGLLVLTQLLCQPVPNPPAGAADQAAGKVVGPDPMATQREHFEFARKAAPECIACHGTFVPFGLGLEHFDALGKYRKSEFGKTLDTTVELKGYGDADGKYPSTLELAAKIAGSEWGRRCFVEQLGSYHQGREIDAEASRCEVDALADRFAASKLSVPELLVDLSISASAAVRRRVAE